MATTPSSAATVGQQAGSPYLRLFRLPGAKAFCISGAIARLPISMMSLVIVLALNHLYDNWTIAGTMSAVYILAVSAVTPFYARLFDRLGQRRVGFPVLALQVASMLVFAFAAMARVPIAVLFVLAVLMGLCQFSIGALVRTRWAYALRGNPDASLLNTAYALEAAVDEIVFILGPILAAFLATSVSPVSQLFVPTFAAGIGGAVFFSLRNTAPPVIEVVEVNPHPPTTPTCCVQPVAGLKPAPTRPSHSTAAVCAPRVAAIVACSPTRVSDRCSPYSLCSTSASTPSTCR